MKKAEEMGGDRPFDILVVGELNPDLILDGDVVPAFGQVEKVVDQASLVIGSSAAIFACGAARLGLKVAFIGKVGNDIFGDFMLNQLSVRGIDTRRVIRDPVINTGLSVILNRGNDRACLTFPGTIPELTFEEIPVKLLKSACHLHLTSYFIQTALRPDVPALFDLAHQHGVSTSLDTNYDPSETWDGGLAEVLERCDIFIPNAVEALAVTRSETIPAALEKLGALVKTVAIKLGAEGATASSGAEVVSAASLPTLVVDTVGAGDTFDAGFIYGCLAGWDLGKSLRLGCICGSLSTCGTGGTAAQPSLKEALGYINQQ